MEQEKSLMKSEDRGIAVLNEIYDSIEQATVVCQFLLDSKLCPAHFYEKTGDKIDFAKGKAHALAVVAWHGKKLGWDVMTAMQLIVPVNGLISIKGDGAKSLIFSSGKLKAGSWVEKEEGSIDADNYTVHISATRSDNGASLTRSFSVGQAKRAGLWITEEMVKRQDGWKYQHSPWYKYPARMVYYRALGFLARDLFGDVMQGTYTMEEAVDMPQDQTMTIEQEDGTKIIIPDSQHAQGRSQSMTKKIVDKIDRSKLSPLPGVSEEPIHNTGQVNTAEYPKTPEEASPEPLQQEEGPTDPPFKPDPPRPDGYLTIEQMMNMETEDLMVMVQNDSELSEALMLIPGKNTNKKLRELIFAYQEGKLEEHLKPFLDADAPEEPPAPGPVQEEEPEETSQDGTTQQDSPAETGDAPSSLTNKYDLEVPDFDEKDKRSFNVALPLYKAMIGITPPLNNERYAELLQKFPGQLSQYRNRDLFCTYAPNDVVHWLLNQN